MHSHNTQIPMLVDLMQFTQSYMLFHNLYAISYSSIVGEHVTRDYVLIPEQGGGGRKIHLGYLLTETQM